MQVLLVNGSPHANGCVYTALSEISKTLNQEGIESLLFHIGNKEIHGCIACGKCRETGRCIFNNDTVNECISLAEKADAIIVGSPVYYAGPNGALCALMDRMFFATGKKLAFKPAAAIVSCRRGGASSSLDRLNKYFSFSNMPLVSSQYWNEIHGNTPEEVLKDVEGLQIMRTLGRNMAWLLKCIDYAKRNGLSYPKQEVWTPTNFIR